MKLTDALAQLGLNAKETATYLAALELGETLLRPLAQHAHVKRPTLYEVLPRLHELGLVSYGRKGKRRTIIAQEPAKLLYLQEERLENLRTVLPELISRYNVIGATPRVLTYEGVKGIKQVYEDTLTEELPIRSFLQVAEIEPEIETYLLKSYVPRRVKRRIHVKNLVSGSEGEATRILPDAGTYRENRFVDQKLFPANIEVLIYSNKVAFVTYKTDSPAMGIIIESGQIAETMRSFHSMAWEFARP
ncbi:hypothetical protein HY375_00375 [Candidatus Berkelbacteria bacterium]|nr:hypothetical protein [Candidatus Berkelbacteria bacterium]